jgi:hypothetical protein
MTGRGRGESGQALIGTLVIMVLVFAMAGSVALAASSLLDRQNSHRNAIAGDLRSSDAIAAAVANIAGRGPQSSPPCPVADSFMRTLPGGWASSVSCLRFDAVAVPNSGTGPVVGAILLNWDQQGSSWCGSALVPASSGPAVWLFFNALNGVGPTSAWVDGRNSGCVQGTQCATPAVGAPVFQAAMNCDLADVPSPAYLHVLNGLGPNGLPSPTVARFVANGTPKGGGGEGAHDGNNQDTNGSIYLLAATTGLSAGSQFEEGAVYVSHDGKTTALLSEGAL